MGPISVFCRDKINLPLKTETIAAVQPSQVQAPGQRPLIKRLGGVVAPCLIQCLALLVGLHECSRLGAEPNRSNAQANQNQKESEFFHVESSPFDVKYARKEQTVD